MRAALVAVAMGIAAAVAATAVASSRSETTTSRAEITRLEAQVRTLDRRLRAEALLRTAQAQTLRLDVEALNSRVQSQTSALSQVQARKLRVTVSPGGPAIIQPDTWGTAAAGSCISGDAVGVAFRTDYPAMVGGPSVSMALSPSWSVAAYNPGSRQLLLSTQLVCLSLG
jgi:hypothetical protein